MRTPTSPRAFTFLAVVFVAAAVAKDPPPALRAEIKLPSGREIGRPFGCLPGDGPPPAADIVVDDSGTMTGFLRSANGGKYVELLEAVMTSISHTCKVRKLSRVKDTVKSVDSLKTDDFYRSKFTRLENAFDFFSTLKPDRVGVFITDLKQDSPDGDFSVAAAAYTRALETRPYVLILAFRSAFSGQLKPVCSPDCPSQQRPLFVVVMASSAKQLRAFADRTRIVWLTYDGELRDVDAARSNGPFYFYSTEAPVEITDIDVIPTANPPLWKRVGYTQLDCGGQGMTRPAIGVSYLSGSADPRPRLKLRLKIRVHAPITDLMNAQVTASRMHSFGANAAGASDAVVSSVATRHLLRPTGGETTLTFEYELSVPPRGGWLLHRFAMTPGDSNVEPPPWVRDWGRATSGLETLVKIAIEKVTERTPMLEHFVAVSRDQKP